MKKRGLSAVVTTLIIILLVLVAVGVVWVVIYNLITESSQEVDLGKFTVNLDLESVIIKNYTELEVNVKRNPGKGELKGLKFIISNGAKTEIINEYVSINELETKNFILNYSGFVKEISIAPIFESSSGKEVIGDEISKKEFTTSKIMDDLGAIAWWRFEGDARDEIGDINGTISNGITFVPNNGGQAVDLSGGTGINMGTLGEPFLTNETTVAFWVKMHNFSYPSRQNPFDQGYGGWGTMTFEPGGTVSWYFGANGANLQPYNGFYSGQMITNNEWTQIAIVRNPQDYSAKWYKDGKLIRTLSYNHAYPVIHSRIFTIGDGYTHPLNGQIDEFMIFNKALTSNEMKALYEFTPK